MIGEESFSIKREHAAQVLAWWHETLKASNAFRTDLLNQPENKDGVYTSNPKLQDGYVSNLLTIYSALMFKFKGYDTKPELEKKFSDFRPYYFDPRKFNKETEKIIELEEILAEAMEEYMKMRMD